MKAIVVSDLHHKDKQWLESLQADSDVDLVAVAGDIDINVRRVPHHNRLAAELRKIYPCWFWCPVTMIKYMTL